MAIFEFKIEVTPWAVPEIDELLGEREEQHLMMVEDKLLGRAWLTGYFESREASAQTWNDFARSTKPEWLASSPSLSELADRDWKESYKEHFKAWKFGRLNWVPTWERESFLLPTGEEVLWLDPGMAFGTGNHETTRLVVERMITLAAEGGTEGRVIDAGCGSGILALSAAKLGYRQVAAFDNDPLAVEVSRENARLNGLLDTVEFYVGDLVSGLMGRQAELVLANIQADVLMTHAAQLMTALAPRGAMVLSGILAIELPAVRDAFASLAPDCSADVRTLGEWSDLVLMRPEH